MSLGFCPGTGLRFFTSQIVPVKMMTASMASAPAYDFERRVLYSSSSSSPEIK
jgi:hypothetical protein